MRVAMYYSNSDVRIEEVPIPEIEPGELLIRVHASGICGSDVLEWYRIDKVPLVLGHEIAGEIVKVGKGLEGFKVGDRISASHHVPCEECHYCLSGHETTCETLRKTKFYPGGFSEYIRLPEINVQKGVYPLPDSISYEEATFTEPLACVLRGQRLAEMQKGKTVLVLGSGISGLLHVKLAHALGAKRIIATDINDYRLQKAKEFGADGAIHAKEDLPNCLHRINDGKLADLVILCTGAKAAILQALKSVERGGTILFFAASDKDAAISLTVNDVFWRNEVTLTSSYAATPGEHIEALGLIASGKVDVKEMITHRLPLAEAHIGFKLVTETANESIKVIIEPQK
ncbi:MAG: alcohol dehydrogenase catalytic domain-containing protein [Candidatus Omnitrophica bacterium]|nr:alcohol dehydrogenase catalytic domain-containing protein [Candidatus Omnitrophota bacterium]